MPCTHKFFGHAEHLPGENGLLPNWDADTLIIGTFNPSNEWNNQNDANYFYGRPRNFFWKVLPRFACQDEINRQDDVFQINFLKKRRIAVTDLLISVDDADLNIPQHILRIKRFLDNDLLTFDNLNWNTNQIINFITEKKIKEVYFTRYGIYNDLFDEQVTEVENQTGLHIHRLHTPSGQGLKQGKPRKNKLIQRWYEQGGDQFPFLCPGFDPNNFPWE